MRVDIAKEYLTAAISYLERASEEKNDIYLYDIIAGLQRVIAHLDDSELYAEMVANERFGHPRHLKAE